MPPADGSGDATAAAAPRGRATARAPLLRQLRVPPPPPPPPVRRAAGGSGGGPAPTAVVRCPALSLAHEPGHAPGGRGTAAAQDRRAAEDYAAGLLRRRVVCAPDGGAGVRVEDGAGGGGFATVSRPAELPALVLRNVAASFAVLLDCRLRAYAALAATAAPALAALLTVRERLAVSGASLAFDVAETEAEAEDAAGATAPLRMTAQLSVCFAPHGGDRRTIAVKIAAPGFIRDVQSARPAAPAVEIEIDTPALLSEMIHQASLVISSICDTSAAAARPETTVPRSASFLVMPPPPAKPPRTTAPATTTTTTTTTTTSGLEMLSRAAAGLFGPALAAAAPPPHAPDRQDWTQESPPPPHATVVSDDEEVAVSCLSPEQCASIVDDVFEELDDDFCLGPPAKRFRASDEAPRTTRGTFG